MPSNELTLTPPQVEFSGRARKIADTFDLTETNRTKTINYQPLAQRIKKDWQIGLITGNSGTGKTTVARAIFGEGPLSPPKWLKNKPLVDNFSAALTTEEIIDALTKAGLGTAPQWLMPHQYLSVGEQFRANIARQLVDNKPLILIDEFTANVDRTVAKAASETTAKAIRKTATQFVAISCHQDIEAWLQPDWVWDSTTQTLRSECLRRPEIQMRLHTAEKQRWNYYRDYHYLSHTLHNAAKCYELFHDNTPVAFAAIMHHPHPRVRDIRRVHRLVVRPEYQGLGIANRMITTLAEIEKTKGYRLHIGTTHPAFAKSLAASKNWAYLGRSRPASKTAKITERNIRSLSVHRFRAI